MILKIEQSKYYGYNNKTKELFKRKYRSLKLKWMENVKLGDDIVDGWISDDLKQYLLKLPEEGEYKRFTGNSVGMIEFLKNHGAMEIEGEEKGVHKDYDNKMGFVDQVDRYSTFIGADLVSHFRVEEMLSEMPDNWEGVMWNDKKIVNQIIKKRIIRKVIRRIKKI